MKTVRATALGFRNGTRVRPGAVFSVPDHVTGKWFEEIERPQPPAPPTEDEAPVPRRIRRADLG